MLLAVSFYLFALLAILAGIVVVTRQNPISSAVGLVACFFFLAGMYVMMDAHFVAIMQVLVYAGAIMVLFIFVIMLLNLRGGDVQGLTDMAPRALIGLGVAGFMGMGLMLGIETMRAVEVRSLEAGVGVAGFGTIEQVGLALFSGKYLLPFEFASALLTVAMVGAVVLGKRDI